MAEHELVRRFLTHQAEFLGYALAITRDLDAAEEILQEVAVVLIEEGAGEGIADFRAWAKEVVRRQALGWLRKHIGERKRRVSQAMLDSLAITFEEEDPEPQVRSELAALRDCLQRLSAHARRLLALRYQQRASFEAIADEIRASAPSVQRALHRIRVSLRSCVLSAMRSP
jgi:RNA polymerase sigma-70 factor (ECF subfamily)